MSALLRRIASLLVFAVILLPLLLVAAVTIATAAFAWLACGSNEERTDRILLNPVLGGIADLPFRVLP